MTSLCVEGVRQVGQIVAGMQEKMHVQKKSEDGPKWARSVLRSTVRV